MKLPLLKWAAAGVGSGLQYTVVLAVTTDNISDAIEIVREERAWTRAERDAFDTFIQRIDTTPVTQESPPRDTPQRIIGNSPAETDHLQQIQQAYEETVMDVAHYEKEYDDTVAESMVEEFGPEITTQIVSGRSFTPLLKQQLLQAARQCRHDREEFLSILEMEQEVLETAQTTLDDVAEHLDRVTMHLPSEQSLDDLITTYTRLDDIEQECNELLTDRQQQRTEGHANIDTPQAALLDLQTYLYSSPPVTYPVLADTTDLLETLQRTRHQIARETATRF